MIAKMMTLMEASVEIDGLMERLAALDGALEDLEELQVEMPAGWSSAFNRFRDCLRLVETRVIAAANAEMQTLEDMERRAQG